MKALPAPSLSMSFRWSTGSAPSSGIRVGKIRRGRDRVRHEDRHRGGRARGARVRAKWPEICAAQLPRYRGLLGDYPSRCLRCRAGQDGSAISRGRATVTSKNACPRARRLPPALSRGSPAHSISATCLAPRRSQGWAQGLDTALDAARAGRTCHQVSAWRASSGAPARQASRIGYSNRAQLPPHWGDTASLRQGDTTARAEHVPAFPAWAGGGDCSQRTFRVTAEAPEILTSFPRDMVVKG
jgi:hypothetical protein